jgi:hypothetical protein
VCFVVWPLNETLMYSLLVLICSCGTIVFRNPARSPVIINTSRSTRIATVKCRIPAGTGRRVLRQYLVHFHPSSDGTVTIMAIVCVLTRSSCVHWNSISLFFTSRPPSDYVARYESTLMAQASSLAIETSSFKIRPRRRYRLIDEDLEDKVFAEK